MKDREKIIEERNKRYHNFWDDCPLFLLRHHLAFKSLRQLYITEGVALREEMIDIVNYAEKILERLNRSASDTS